MGRIVVTEFISLDGVIEEPRWAFDFDRAAEGDKFKYDELFEAEALRSEAPPTRVSPPPGPAWGKTSSGSA